MKKRIAFVLVLACMLVSLTVPVFAWEGSYIYETTDVLLSAGEAEVLEQQCADTAAAYGCGIYVVVLDDFSEYHPDPFEAAQVIYRDMGFGIGENKNGILLMLSLSERDYALVSYGDIANSVFTDRMQDRIIDDFLDDFGVNNWEGGLSDYVYHCSDALANFDGTVGESYSGYYEDGVYYEKHDRPRLQYVLREFGAVIGIGSLVIALVVCLVMKSRMKTARIATGAGEYIPQGGVDLHVRQDVFTHTTRQVIHHERDHGSGGGTSVGSSGFSGRSGKF